MRADPPGLVAGLSVGPGNRLGRPGYRFDSEPALGTTIGAGGRYTGFRATAVVTSWPAVQGTR